MLFSKKKLQPFGFYAFYLVIHPNPTPSPTNQKVYFLAEAIQVRTEQLARAEASLQLASYRLFIKN